MSAIIQRGHRHRQQCRQSYQPRYHDYELDRNTALPSRARLEEFSLYDVA
ncbi:hypothetical protein WH47_12058 [Habropoda laboriosa]|uniref:Uncharacterized protein n=1 Tax=Habropoda laboriosa TaxID=597456 RepID=A0A0L7R176_9HYME|nr:hypothetical protein WH47_12058 [Habropoda laboriosa]